MLSLSSSLLSVSSQAYYLPGMCVFDLSDLDLGALDDDEWLDAMGPNYGIELHECAFDEVAVLS